MSDHPSLPRCANQLKCDTAWRVLLDAVPAVISKKLHFSTEALGPEHHANFKRNKACLEFLGLLQKGAKELGAPDPDSGATHAPMDYKRGYGHHEACMELLQPLCSA